MLEVERYEAIAGLDRQADGALTSPVASLRLRAYQGFGEVKVTAVQVSYVVGATRVGPLLMMVPPTVLTAASDKASGMPADLSVPLPTGDVRQAIAAAGAGASVKAEVRFVDHQGFLVLNTALEPLTVSLPLSLGATATPAAQLVPAAATPAAAPSVQPGPVSIDGSASKPKVADLASFSPVALRLKNGALDANAAKVRLYAWAGSEGTTVTSYSVAYGYATPGEIDKPITSKAVTKTLPAPVTIPAATDTALGAPVELTLALDAADLRSQVGTIRPGLIDAQVELIDPNGFVVLDSNFQNLTLRLPILAD
ncbi:hypothetical protein D3C72_784390 [compost metagenome]